MTWSIATLLDDTKKVAKYLAALAFAPVLDVVYPPCDGAEQLAEREAEEEVAEPADECRRTRRDRNLARRAAEDPGCVFPDETPNPTEPALTDDELVAVRQLIEERFPLQTLWSPPEGGPGSPVLETGLDMGGRWAAECFPQHQKTSAPTPAPTSTTEVRPPASVGPLSSRMSAFADVMSTCESHRVNHFEPLDDWDCPCGERFPFESDWRYHLGEKIADALNPRQ